MQDFAQSLEELETSGLLRRRRVVRGKQGATLEVDGEPMLAFASNDYLGLASDPRISRAVAEAIERCGVGGGASHLISGHHEEHERAEDALARFVGLPRALLFSSGYMANSGIVPALAGRGDAVFSDALNHACLIDGARLSRADVHVFPHGDMDALNERLARSSARRRLILSDAVFSMDGDIAPLARLVELCERHDALLLLDDAHGFGVLGAEGRGTLAHCNVKSDRILYLGTLGKAAGVAGAFVAGASQLIEWLIQRARTYIFTTAMPPMLAAGVRAAVDAIAADEWRRTRLRDHARRLRDGLRELPWPLLASDTAIQPLMVGDNRASLTLMERLWQAGVWVPAIRPPTVPDGTARLRISLSAAHTPEHIDRLVEGLRAVAADMTGNRAAA
ncbi:MAG: 8-amino-7-oxononanoate synthase [Betaproteobacteria bacterium]|nr:8-amino-7-oxononanoate synthase [Betaproteobacteria bacterium]